MSEDFSFDELLKKLYLTYQEAEMSMGQCNILIIGKTGVGKSTLINSIFREPLANTGSGYPVTQEIRRYTKSDFPITVYDTPGLESSSEQIIKLKTDISDLINNQRLEPLKEHIHVIWYCISNECDRLENIEKEWLQELQYNDVHTILVLTKTLQKKNNTFLSWLKQQNLPVRYIIPILSEAMELDDEIMIKSHGLERLVEATFESLPEVAQKAFVNGVKSIDLKAKEAFKYVTGYVTGASIIGASPIPLSDAPLLATLQTAMLVHITLIFGLPFDKGFISSILSTITGAGGLSLLGRTIVSNLLKMIPGPGTIVGGFISATTAATLTLALGFAYIEALKKYMKMKINGQDMDIELFKEIFKSGFKNYSQQGYTKLINLPALPENLPKDIEIE